MNSRFVSPVADILIFNRLEHHVFGRVAQRDDQPQFQVLGHLEEIGEFRRKGADAAAADALGHGAEQQVLAGDAQIEVRFALIAFEA